MLLGIQLYRAAILDNAHQEWLPSVFNVQELAAVYCRDKRLPVDWTSAALPAVEPTWTAGKPGVQGRPPRPLPQPIWQQPPAPAQGDPTARLSGPPRATTPAPRRLQQRLARLWPVAACRVPASPTARADLPRPQAPAAAERAAPPGPSLVGRSSKPSADAARPGLATAPSSNGDRAPRERSGESQNGCQPVIPGPAALGADASRSPTRAPVSGSTHADWDWAPRASGQTA